MKIAVMPAYAISLDPEIVDDYVELQYATPQELEVIARIHKPILVNSAGEALRGTGAILAARLLGYERVRVEFAEREKTQMIEGDMKGIEVRIGPAGTVAFS